MNTFQLPMNPGRCPYNEYLLVLNPNSHVQEKILRVREDFSKIFKVPSPNLPYPHITLVSFLQFKILENRLISRLKIIAMGHPPFTVSLKDYGSLPAHSLLVNIESKQQVRNLICELTSARRLMTLNSGKRPHFTGDPHLIIARNLLPWQYEKSWNQYSHKHFTARFMAENMVLLRRPVALNQEGNIIFGKYQKVMQFKFMNLPVTTKQGKLFGA